MASGEASRPLAAALEALPEPSGSWHETTGSDGIAPFARELAAIVGALGERLGLATALAGDDAQRFDHALVDSVHGFARSHALAARAAGEDHVRDPGPFDPSLTFEWQFDAALRAVIASVAGDCSQAQLIELVHRHAQGVWVPDPVTDPETLKKYVDVRMPPVPAGESKAESAAQHLDRPQRCAWIATGLLLEPDSPTAVARIEGLTLDGQIRLFEAACNDDPLDIVVATPGRGRQHGTSCRRATHQRSEATPIGSVGAQRRPAPSDHRSPPHGG